jgi:predicted PurR-regulated permease PerM
VAPRDAQPSEERTVIRISGVSAAMGVGIVVLALLGQRIFVAAHRPLSWAAAATVIAVLIDPLVGVLGRHISRPLAVLLALLVVGGALFGVVYRATDEVNNGLDRMGEAAQEAAADLERRDDGVGDLARDVEARRRVDDFVEALEARATGGEEVLRSTAGTAPTYVIGAIFTIFLLSYGPRLAQAGEAQLRDPARRARARRVVPRALVRARRAVLFTTGEGVVAGVAVGLGAAWLSVPAPAALGLFAGVLTLLPHVGLVLGCLPFLLLMLSDHSDSATLAVALVVVLVQLVDSTLVRPALADRSVHVGLLVPWAVALVGYAVYGIGGAAYGLAFAVFALAVIDERERADYEAEAAGGEPAADGGTHADGGTGPEAGVAGGGPAATEADVAEAGALPAG